MEKPLKVRIPDVPNFLLVGDEKTAVSIGKFTDEELKQVGIEWTEKLIDNAKKKRK